MASGLYAGVSSGPKTASGQISANSGTLLGIFVSSSSSLTLKAWDSLTAANTVLFDTTAAITAPAYIPVNMTFSTGLYITIGGSGSFAAVYVS
jgi:hypothetical protein